jgi:hypothetical protein
MSFNLSARKLGRWTWMTLLYFFAFIGFAAVYNDILHLLARWTSQ